LIAVFASQEELPELLSKLCLADGFHYSTSPEAKHGLCPHSSYPVDLLIDATSHYLNKAPINLKDIFGDRFEKVEIFYSSPERYTQCKYVDFLNTKERATVTSPEYIDQLSRSIVEPRKGGQNSVNWKMKSGDFFPYADCDHCYWTGFFSSRQGLKRLERVGSSFLHAARQIESIRKLQIRPAMPIVSGKLQGISKLTSSARSWNESPLYVLDDAMGVAQHHDAVAGVLNNSIPSVFPINFLIVLTTRFLCHYERRNSM